MAIYMKKIECPCCHKVDAKVRLSWKMAHHFIPKYLPMSRIECEMSGRDPRCPYCLTITEADQDGRLCEHWVNSPVPCPGSGLKLFPSTLPLPTKGKPEVPRG